jgi:hypothetical protein
MTSIRWFSAVWLAGVVLGASVPAHAQATGDAAHFYYYRLGAGMQAKFEDGYRRHLAWHRAHHDRLVWYGWMIDNGARAGQFVDANVGEPFAAFDYRVDVADDGKDFQQNAAPYVTPAAQETYLLLRDISFRTPLESRQPSANMQVLTYRVRPGTEGRFEAALRVARRALENTPDAPAHTWYRLVVGGTQSTYVLQIARADWASYDRFHRSIADLLDAEPAALADYVAAVSNVESETWSYRAELSNLP